MLKLDWGLRALAGAGLLLWGSLAAGGAAAQDAEAVLKARCAECHERLPDGGLNRITNMRKTPEGWHMTIVRMDIMHGVKTSPEEQRALVKFLADRQGLAPEETASYRYILERTPNIVEDIPADGDVGTLCARCHSFARIALQRREADEWLKLAHFHLGQWPTAEYQAMSRDRRWWEIVSTETPKQLGQMFPLKTKAWGDWLKQPKAPLDGTWRVAGHRPGVGSYGGTMVVKKTGQDTYAVSYDLMTADGKPLKGAGESIVYTGYEWRGTAKLGNEEVSEVFAVSKDGKSMRGRWFLDVSEIGGTMTAVRDGSTAVLGMSRPYVKAGETARVTVWGAGLGPSIDLGRGVTAQVVAKGADHVVVDVKAAPDAAPGLRDVTSGQAKGKGIFAVYRSVDTVRVEPAFAIARVGGNGGKTPKIPAQFEAVGYINGPDGKPGTDDDVRIGPMPASWSFDNNGEVAQQMEDAKFAGAMEANGLFMPAGAGPNPQRAYGTNNVGDLLIKAAVKDGGATVEGEGRLIVTVQRWNDPPIR